MFKTWINHVRSPVKSVHQTSKEPEVLYLTSKTDSEFRGNHSPQNHWRLESLKAWPITECLYVPHRAMGRLEFCRRGSDWNIHSYVFSFNDNRSSRIQQKREWLGHRLTENNAQFMRPEWTLNHFKITWKPEIYFSSTFGYSWSNLSYAGGNGSPLQYSCLRNSMDREAWRATAHSITKSQIRLSTRGEGSLKYTFLQHWLFME